jgi:ribonuclease R
MLSPSVEERSQNDIKKNHLSRQNIFKMSIILWPIEREAGMAWPISRNFSMRKRTAQKTNTLQGKLDLHSDGYGFVIPDKKGKNPDLFIPPHQVSGAMDGDRVEAILTSHRKGKRQEGKIVKVLERAKSQLVGRFEVGRSGFSVICEDRRNFWKVNIPSEQTMNALAGQNVVVKIHEYPEDGGPLQGEVVKLLGEREDPATETEVIVAEHHLQTAFRQKALEQARSYGKNIPNEEMGVRKDLRPYPIVTIDGETAKDFDDGIWVKRIEGGYRLLVAIADVSHYVRPQTPLEREAYGRATSVYFPDRCIPMLPEELSNHLCSLVPHEERLAFVAEMDFDSKGRKTRSDFYKAVIKNAARLTYTLVKRILVDREEEVRTQYSPLLPHLEVAFELFQILREKRLQRGSIDFDLPEPQIVLDIEEGIATSIVKAPRTPAHMLIEEFMVAANEAVAEYMADRELPMIYRVHETPDPEKMGDFKILAHNLGHPLPSVDRIVPKDLADLVRAVRGKPHERLVNTLLLRSLKQAVYSPENVGHFGLASKKYTHFTSPIRRFPDLVVHRLLYEVLEGLSESKKGKKRIDEEDRKRERLSEIAAHCSKMERNAMKAEWAVRDLHVALFMKDKVGGEFEGIVSGVTRFGFFVELIDYFVEGLVQINTLTDDSYEFFEKEHQLRGRRLKRRFQIGDPVRIQVARVDVARRRLDFILVSPEKSR